MTGILTKTEEKCGNSTIVYEKHLESNG